jgi:hypothetical protein
MTENLVQYWEMTAFFFLTWFFLYILNKKVKDHFGKINLMYCNKWINISKRLIIVADQIIISVNFNIPREFWQIMASNNFKKSYAPKEWSNPLSKLEVSCSNHYVSPSNEGRHIVLVWFFLLLLLLLGKVYPDHNFFVFPDRSIIFDMWVHDHKAVCRVP